MNGMQSYEAGDFLRRRPAIEPTTALVLWQIGVVGARTHTANVCRAGAAGARGAPARASTRPATRRWCTKRRPIPASRRIVRDLRLDELGADTVSLASTLYVPPVPR